MHNPNSIIVKLLVLAPSLLCFEILSSQILYRGPDPFGNGCNWCTYFSPQEGCSPCPCEPLPEYTIPAYITQGATLCEYSDEDPWILVFADEFNGEQLNSDNWTTYFPFTQDGSDNAVVTRTGDHNTVYMDDNVTVSDGSLHITTRYQPTTWMGVTKDYTSGVIYSKSPYKFRNGRFEIKCRIPKSIEIGTLPPFNVPYRDADGLWPAFWLHGGPPAPLTGEDEIDIMEICGRSQDEWMGTIHRKYDGCPYHAEGGRTPLYDFADGNFHTFAVEWDKNFLQFQVDEIVRWRYPRLMTSAGNVVLDCGDVGAGVYFINPRYPDPNAIMSIIVNLAMQYDDAEFCGSAVPSLHGAFPKVMDVDYVRAWQRASKQTLPALCSVERVIAGYTGFCAVNDQNLYHVTGPVGNLQWQVSSNLQIVSVENGNCLVRRVGGQTGDNGWITAIETSGGPCGSQPVTHQLAVIMGRPIIEGSGPEIQYECNPYFVIHNPRIHGASPGPGNRYNWFDIYVDGVQQFYTYDPDYIVNWYPDGSYEQGGWPNIDHDENSGFTYYTGALDYCHDIEFRATNNCGTTSQSFTIRDGCILGRCDIEHPDGVAQLSAHTVLFPNPTDGVFTIKLEPDVDVTVIENIVIRDSHMNIVATISSPTDHLIDVNATGWHPGMYYVTFDLVANKTMGKQELK